MTQNTQAAFSKAHEANAIQSDAIQSDATTGDASQLPGRPLFNFHFDFPHLASRAFLIPGLCIAALLLAMGPATAQAALSAATIREISAIAADKATRPPAQQKMDSQLIYAARATANQAEVAGAPRLQADVQIVNGNQILVDITATVSKGLLQQIANAGGQVISSFPAHSSIRALVPVSAIEGLAARKDVRFIGRAVEAETDRVKTAERAARIAEKSAKTARLQKANRTTQGLETAQRVASALRAKSNAVSSKRLAPRLAKGDVFPSAQRSTEAGSLTSEGDISHRADEARSTFGINGAGVKIGVLSDSVDGLAAAQASGNLPAITILPGQAGAADGEGTAMLEIIHDLAPGAELFFATAFGGPASFAQNILDLRAAGCDIIVDDVRYANESPFQAGIIEQAVNTVSADGALYFSSAGNSGNKSDGTSGTWVGDFATGGAATSPPFTSAGILHNFAAATPFNTVAAGGSSLSVGLFWSDPLGASVNDYDVYVTDSTGAVLRSSTNTQNGTQDPFETIATLNVGERIVIVKETGAANRYLYLTSGRGRLAVSTSGFSRAHNAANAANAFSVAATDAGANVDFVGGAANPVESFSSDGPRRMFFNPTGGAFTPGNFSSTGGLVIQKPDFTAADGVKTSTSGFNPFFGTSAAAPHAAAIAGLLLSYNSAMTPAQVRTALQSTALDIETVGTDRDAGVGVIMALQAIQAAPVPAPKLVFSSSALSGGNGNGSVDPNECNQLNITLRNAIGSSGNAATGVSAVLTTNTAGVTITQANSTYPNVPANGTATNITPFRISTSPAFVCGTVIQLSLAVTTANAGNFTILRSLSPGGGAGAPTVFASTDVPKAISDNNASGVDSVVNVSGITSVAKVSVSLHITHTFDSDLTLQLKAPDGTTVNLSNSRGGSGDNYGSSCSGRTVFEDTAATAISAGSAPFVGSFRPEAPLSAFIGKSGGAANGAWKLHVVDGVADDVGTIQCWSLSIAEPAGCTDGGGACGGTVPSLGINDVTITEGNTGTQNATFTVTLSAASAQTVTVNFATTNATAIAPGDYTTTNGALSFTPGQTSKTIVVPIVGELVDESNETFQVNLSGAVNATIADALGIGTITDNDAPPIVPSISINDLTASEGNTGTSNATFTVTLSAASAQTVTVNFATTNATAIAPGDYTTTNGALSFTPGQTSKTIVVPIVGELVDESNETFQVNLSGAVNATIADALGVGTIADNDGPPGSPSISINDVTVTEGDSGTQNATFTVTLSKTSTQTISIGCIPSNGTAIAPADFTSGGATLVFSPGQTSKTFSVPVKGDLLDEVTETFFVLLSSPVNASTGRGRGVCTITDNDAAPTISIDNLSIGEGNTGQRTASFRVNLSSPSGQVVRVSYATAPGTTLPATAGNDYVTVAPTQVAISAGNSFVFARVLINGDALTEPNETFFVNLTAPVNATIADAQALGTILNDDTAPSLSINNVSISEGNSGTKNLIFTVTMSKASGQTVTVNFATANGAAIAPGDYTAQSGTLSFAPSTALTRTISVPIKGDITAEANETLFVFLSAAVNASIGTARGTGTITNDDPSG